MMERQGWSSRLLTSIFLGLVTLTPAAAEGPKAVFGIETRYEALGNGTGRLRVDAVRPNGPAAKAGIKLGDRILKLGGKTLSFANDLEYMRSLAGYEPGVPIRIELLRAGEPLQLSLVPEPASPEHLAALAVWMEKLRLCFEDNICQPCMAPSNSCAAQTDEMRKIEASEELEEQIKSRPGVVFDLSRDPSGKAMLSSPEIKLPSSLDPERYAYLTPRFRELQHGQSMRIRLTIEENGRVRTRILELPHSRIELP